MLKKKYFFILGCLGLISCSATNPEQTKTKPRITETATIITTVDPNQAYSKARNLNNFSDYVKFLKGKALALDIPLTSLQKHRVNYLEEVVIADRNQVERRQKNGKVATKPDKNGLSNYLKRTINKNKLNQAMLYANEYKDELSLTSKKYMIPKEIILSLWGLESSFGKYQGKHDVLSSLATLAFDGRRENLFSKEFIAALRILDAQYIQRENMLGSWAGAMGQSQFMPSSYLHYAVDADNDNKKDIWHNQKDVFASIANYLATIGWQQDIPWGVEVKLTKPISLDQSGIKFSAKNLAYWQKKGVKLKSTNKAEKLKFKQLAKTELWLVRPNKQAGRAFLVSKNYKTLLHWNNSNYFAISVGHFADLIKQKHSTIKSK